MSTASEVFTQLDEDDAPTCLGNQFKAAQGKRAQNWGGFSAGRMGAQATKDDSVIDARKA